MKRLSFALLVVALVTLVACNEYIYPDQSYTGPDLVEIRNQQFQRTSPGRVISNTEFGREVADSFGLNLPAGQRDSFLVQLIGRHRASDLVINFSVTEFPDAAATPPITAAVAGTHFSMITTGGTVTIPAGQSSAWVRIAPIRILGSPAAGMPIVRRRLRITLTGTNQGIAISPNAANFDYTLRD